MSPTQLSLRRLRRSGYLAEVVERWIPGANVRRDLFGVVDVLAVSPGLPILGVQTTTAGNMAARLAKARASGALAVWLRAGGRFEVHGWRLVAGRWEARVVELAGEDLAETVLATPRRCSRSRHVPGDLFEGAA